MALDRTNMVSLMDIGKWLGGTTSNIAEMGDGFKEISEDWGPNFKENQYVNMKNSSSSLNGYAFSLKPEREHLSDAFQTAINSAFKKMPVGTNAQSYYYRFYKTDITTGAGECIRIPIVAGPSSTGGGGGDSLTSSLEIKGTGDVELGIITISETGVYTWAKATT